MFRRVLILVVAFGSLGGCSADDPLNPSFPLKLADAREAMCEMEQSPKPLERPVVILAGLMDPGFLPWRVRCQMQELVSNDDKVIGLHFFWQCDFESAREYVIAQVDKAFPSDDPHWTTEVDVIGGSMGGLVARYAAMAPRDEAAAPDAPAGGAGADSDSGAAGDGKPARRLRIARLFTISSPHQGAKMAWIPTFDSRIIDMRRGSPFIAMLNAELPHVPYELYCYVRLHDATVGEQYAAPPGRTAWWVQNIPLTSSHISSYCDPRILADIARRLRGETPYTTDPPAPLPAD